VTPRVVWFDLEGTGVDPHRDRIVEICMISDDGRELETRVNPGVPIPAEASAVHGITDEDVKDAPTFAEIAGAVQELVDGAVLAGYNSRRYDVPLIDAELRRAGQPGLPRDELGRIALPEIDLFAIWSNLEPRNLASAARRFAGVELVDAHSASADTRVLPDVLRGICFEFALDADDLDELVRLSVRDGSVDRDGKFLVDENGVVVFNFGQKRGTPVSAEPGLLEWMLSRDFSPETKAFARLFLGQIYADEPIALPAPVPAGVGR